MLIGKKAYICSPLSAPTKEKVLQNMENARFYMQLMNYLYHCRTIASHAYYPVMLDDSIPEEREIALSIGLSLMKLCDALIICGEHISDGMYGEIKTAFENGMEVYWYDSREKPRTLVKVECWRYISDEMQTQKKYISK